MKSTANQGMTIGARAAAVAEHRSFSRAANTSFVSQPAVSKAVRQLEHQLDLALIERGPGGTRGVRGVRLTESGQALFEHARGIFALERAATEEVRARVGLKRGRLVVGASTTIAGYWLPTYAARVCTTGPFGPAANPCRQHPDDLPSVD